MLIKTKRVKEGFFKNKALQLPNEFIDNPYLEEKMFNEDEYLKALIDRDNKISLFLEKLEKTAEELENEKSKTKQLRLVLAKVQKANGISIESIHKETGLQTDDIEKL